MDGSDNAGSIIGIFTHGMGGIDRNMVRDLLLLNEQEHSVIMGFAVGKKADSELLPENLRDKEKPSNRMIWKVLEVFLVIKRRLLTCELKKLL